METKDNKEITKTSKPVKMQDIKKLPKLFKKQYTQKKLDKLLKHIYIEDDKKLVQSLFVECGKNKKDLPLFAIKEDAQIIKKDGKRLKKIAKDIKSQKGRIKFAPLIAVVSLILFVCIIFTTFKNRIIKRAIVNTCELIFEAKCDINYVDLRLFNASFRLNGLQQANKNEPMKNLYQIEDIIFDFDLTQLLRGNFVTDEISVTGILTNTDRKTSGDISARIARKKQQIRNSTFVKTVTQRSEAAVNSMKDSVQKVIDDYNPVNVVEKCYSQMTSPTIAKQTEEKANLLIEKYKAKPDEIKKRYEHAKEVADKVSKMDLYSIKTNPLKIKDAIQTIDEASKEIKSLKEDIQTLSNDMQKDYNEVQTLYSNIKKSINHDKNLVSGVINKYKSLNLSDGKKFISNTLDTAVYKLLGKYYPYSKQLVSYLTQMKNTPKKEKAPTQKEKLYSKVGKRAAGRNVYYRKNPPKFWIKQINASGENFSFKGRDFSSDMDRSGKPASGEFKIKFKDIDHTGTLVIDTRSDTTNPLVLINYICDKLPVKVTQEDLGAKDVAGVPAFTSSSKLDVSLELFENDGFSLSGKGSLYDMSLTAIPFEPEFVSNIYQNTLSHIKSTNLSAKAGYTISNGLDFNIGTDLDKQFLNAFNIELSNQLSILKKSAEEELNKRINELTGGAVTSIGSLDNIFGSLKDLSNNTNSLDNMLNAKRKEANGYLTGKVDEAKDKAANELKKSAENYLKKLF